jgi:hypothetical protein
MIGTYASPSCQRDRREDVKPKDPCWAREGRMDVCLSCKLKGQEQVLSSCVNYSFEVRSGGGSPWLNTTWPRLSAHRPCRHLLTIKTTLSLPGGDISLGFETCYFPWYIHRPRDEYWKYWYCKFKQYKESTFTTNDSSSDWLLTILVLHTGLHRKLRECTCRISVQQVIQNNECAPIYRWAHSRS